jgi:hypothetical protein
MDDRAITVKRSFEDLLLLSEEKKEVVKLDDDWSFNKFACTKAFSEKDIEGDP